MSDSDLHFALLIDRGVLRVSGEQAPQFLQGLITNDAEPLEPGGACFAGLLTPQGKILFEFFVVRSGEDFLLETRREQTAELAKRLTFYKLRAKVDIADVSDDCTIGVVWRDDGDVSSAEAADALPEGAFAYRDPRAAGLGWRVLLSGGAEDQDRALWSEDAAGHAARRIALAVPEGGADYEIGNTFPHEACYDQLNGVNLHKGCYVGQEVVSRTHHRGKARKRCVAIESGVALPAAGASVMAGQATIGVLGSSAGGRGIAIVRLDRLAEAHDKGEAVTIEGQEVMVRRPSWADYEVAGDEVPAGQTS